MQIVSYLRVSTKEQEDSGLGIKAQRAAVAAYAQRSGAEIIREFVEAESGRKTDSSRPQLALALPFAKRAGAVLVVAKLDRLARNLHFLTSLMQAGVEFAACDMPAANKLVLHIMAAVAEAEADMISQRTKAALQALKRQGVQLGSARPGHWDGREQARTAGAHLGGERAAQVHAQAARAAYADLLPIIKGMADAGQSLRAIAQALNEAGHSTRRGAPYGPMQVARILKRGAG